MGFWIPKIITFIVPVPVHSPIGMSNGSAVFVQLNLPLHLQRTYVKMPLQHEYFRFLDRHIYFIVTATPSDINIIAIENVNPGNIGKL